MKIIGICGYSGSGKTTLLKELIPTLKHLGIYPAVIKHSHHNMDIDIPGKDSYELRKSGADQVIIASEQRWALVTETKHNPPTLKQLVQQFSDVELVLVEGFKDENIPKIVCHRQDNNKPLFYDKYTIAIASDATVSNHIDSNIKQFHLNDIELIAEFIKDSLIGDYLNPLE